MKGLFIALPKVDNGNTGHHATNTRRASHEGTRVPDTAGARTVDA